MNRIHAGSFLTLNYRLSGPDGADLVNTFSEKAATLTLGTGELSPAIEARLIGLEEGVHTEFQLAAGEAFGERNDELLQRVKMSLMRQLGDRTRSTTSATWSSFRRPTARAAMPGACRRWARTGCCSTSTIRWPASR